MRKRENLLPAWLYARRAVLAYVAVLFACFFVVYALYGHGWGVAGYAALLGAAAGLGFAAWDFARFASTHRALARLAGRFPTGALPTPQNLIERDGARLVAGLEAERARLEKQGEAVRRDAEEYYTLWAHQIKTPMAALQLLQQSARAGNAQALLPDMEQELFRIGQYVDMVLQYQRLSSLQSDLVLNRFELASLAKKAAKTCAPLFIHKKLSFSAEGVTGGVITDEKWFCFVLEQLYTNAVKYTQTGGVRVYCREADTLVVEDTGAGIPAEDLPRVFERGFTGLVGHGVQGATGIGLFLCKSILAKLGFGISIESQAGVGTRVVLHLRQVRLELE